MMETAGSSYFFTDKKSRAIRAWHWLVVVFFSCTIICVLLASTVFKAANNVDWVQQQVNEHGGKIGKEQSWHLAHQYADKLWILHEYFGYGLVLLLLWRLVIEARFSTEKRLGAKIRMALQMPGTLPEKKHYKMVQNIYLFFYICFGVMAITGLVLAFATSKWPRGLVDGAVAIHGFFQYGIYGFILFHIVGVIKADLGQYRGIISRMINGK